MDVMVSYPTENGDVAFCFVAAPVEPKRSLLTGPTCYPTFYVERFFASIQVPDETAFLCLDPGAG